MTRLSTASPTGANSRARDARAQLAWLAPSSPARAKRGAPAAEVVMASRLVRANPVTVNDVLDGHVKLDLECLDRIYLHGFLAQLQVGGQVVQFLRHNGFPVPSPACLQQIGDGFRRSVASFADANHIPVVRLKSFQDLHRFPGLRPFLPGSALPRPTRHRAGCVTTRQASLHVTDRSVAHPATRDARRWASTRPVSRRHRQPATGPPDSYPDRTYTGKRRRAYESVVNHLHDQPPFTTGRTRTTT
jgi:hypothetical protein